MEDFQDNGKSELLNLSTNFKYSKYFRHFKYFRKFGVS